MAFGNQFNVVQGEQRRDELELNPMTFREKKIVTIM